MTNIVKHEQLRLSPLMSVEPSVPSKQLKRLHAISWPTGACFHLIFVALKLGSEQVPTSFHVPLLSINKFEIMVWSFSELDITEIGIQTFGRVDNTKSGNTAAQSQHFSLKRPTYRIIVG